MLRAVASEAGFFAVPCPRYQSDACHVHDGTLGAADTLLLADDTVRFADGASRNMQMKMISFQAE